MASMTCSIPLSGERSPNVRSTELPSTPSVSLLLRSAPRAGCRGGMDVDSSPDRTRCTLSLAAPRRRCSSRPRALGEAEEGCPITAPVHRVPERPGSCWERRHHRHGGGFRAGARARCPPCLGPEDPVLVLDRHHVDGAHVEGKSARRAGTRRRRPSGIAKANPEAGTRGGVPHVVHRQGRSTRSSGISRSMASARSLVNVARCRTASASGCRAWRWCGWTSRSSRFFVHDAGVRFNLVGPRIRAEGRRRGGERRSPGERPPRACGTCTMHPDDLRHKAGGRHGRSAEQCSIERQNTDRPCDRQ